MSTANLTQVENYNYGIEKIFDKAQDFYRSTEQTMSNYMWEMPNRRPTFTRQPSGFSH